MMNNIVHAAERKAFKTVLDNFIKNTNKRCFGSGGIFDRSCRKDYEGVLV